MAQGRSPRSKKRRKSVLGGFLRGLYGGRGRGKQRRQRRQGMEGGGGAVGHAVRGAQGQRAAVAGGDGRGRERPPTASSRLRVAFFLAHARSQCPQLMPAVDAVSFGQQRSEGTHDFAPAGGGPRSGEAMPPAKAGEPETSSGGMIMVMRPTTGDVIGRSVVVDSEYSRCRVDALPPLPDRLDRYKRGSGRPGDVTGRPADAESVNANESGAERMPSCVPGRRKCSDGTTVASHAQPVSLCSLRPSITSVDLAIPCFAGPGIIFDKLSGDKSLGQPMPLQANAKAKSSQQQWSSSTANLPVIHGQTWREMLVYACSLPYPSKKGDEVN